MIGDGVAAEHLGQQEVEDVEEEHAGDRAGDRCRGRRSPSRRTPRSIARAGRCPGRRPPGRGRARRARRPGRRARRRTRTSPASRGWWAPRARRRPARCRGWRSSPGPTASAGWPARPCAARNTTAEAELVAHPLARHVEPLPEHRGWMCGLDEVREVHGVEEVRVEGHREGDRGDGEVEAADPQGGQRRWRRPRARPATIAAPMATNRSRFQRVMRLPAAIDAMPTMPNWPRLMLPPQPVSTTSDIATRPHTTAKVRVVTVDGVMASGTNTAISADHAGDGRGAPTAPRRRCAARAGSA